MSSHGSIFSFFFVGPFFVYFFVFLISLCRPSFVDSLPAVHSVFVFTGSVPSRGLCWHSSPADCLSPLAEYLSSLLSRTLSSVSSCGLSLPYCRVSLQSPFAGSVVNYLRLIVFPLLRSVSLFLVFVDLSNINSNSRDPLSNHPKPTSSSDRFSPSDCPSDDSLFRIRISYFLDLRRYPL